MDTSNSGDKRVYARAEPNVNIPSILSLCRAGRRQMHAADTAVVEAQPAIKKAGAYSTSRPKPSSCRMFDWQECSIHAGPGTWTTRTNHSVDRGQERRKIYVYIHICTNRQLHSDLSRRQNVRPRQSSLVLVSQSRHWPKVSIRHHSRGSGLVSLQCPQILPQCAGLSLR